MAETIRSPVFYRYEGLTKIGSGSMGAVYKARDARLDRWVALKVLPPGLREDAEAMERFRREAGTLAQLKHAGVASVYDAETQGDFPHLVMEFVEGENLEQVLRRRGPLSVEEVVRLGIEIAEALEHIHCHRIVHRDIKSANIIIGPEGRAVVVDFGVAYRLSLPRISQGALGTPEYMSPEQADGRPTDGRSDLYSVGVVLYECLTGEVPFKRSSEGLSALADMLKRARDEPAAAVREQCKTVPAWLDEVILRCLAKRPEDRYTNAAALAAALRKDTRAAEADAEPPVAALATRPGADRPAQTPGRPVVQHVGAAGLVISHLEPVDAIAFSPNGKRMASTSKDGAIRVWEPATGRLLHLLKGHAAQTVSFSRGGTRLASGGVDGGVCIWDVNREQRLHRIEAHQGYVLAVAYSRDGKYLASGGIDGAVRIWNAKTGRLVRTLGWQYSYVLSVSFSPDGRRLASSGADGAVRIWDAATGDVEHMLKGHAGYIGSVSFSPDGRRLASSGADATIRLWEVATGNLLGKMEGHTDWVTSVSFSPDGQRLASGSRDYTVRLWEAQGGRPIRKLKGHTGAVTSVSFSPDGSRLASSSSDHTVRVWPISATYFARRVSIRAFIAMLIMLGFAALGVWHDELPRLDAADFSLDRFWSWVTAAATLPPAAPAGIEARRPPPAQQAQSRPPTSARPTARPAPTVLPSATPPPAAAEAQPGVPPALPGPDDRAHLAAEELAAALDADHDVENTTIDDRWDGPSQEQIRPEDDDDVPQEAWTHRAAERGTRTPAQAGQALHSTEGLLPYMGGWTLIVALEETRVQAFRVADRYREQGYRVGVMRVLARGKLSYRVGVGQFETQAAAGAVRRHLVDQGAVPLQTWLMRIRLATAP